MGNTEPANFPYRPLFEELTGVVKDRGYDAVEACAWLHEQEQARSLRGDTYFSTSITTGGHRRDDSLPMQEVIRRNTKSATLMVNQLVADDQVSSETILEPVFVGNTGWKQGRNGFMPFWLMRLSGFTFTPGFVARDADNLRTQMDEQFERYEIDFGLMDSNAPVLERKPEYFKMARAVTELVVARHVPAEPMKELIQGVDTGISVGCDTEKLAVVTLGGRISKPCPVQPASLHDLESRNPSLASDAANLVAMGAEVFDDRNRNVRLILQSVAA